MVVCVNGGPDAATHPTIALFVYALLSLLIERMIHILFSRPKV